MKRILIAASCLILIAPTIAEGQNSQEQNGKPEHRQQKPSGEREGGGNDRPDGGGTYQPNYKPAPNYGGQQGEGGGNNQPNYGRPNYGGGNGGRPNYGSNYRGQRRYGVWNGQRFRGGGWAWPGGYSYRRWWVGGILPGIFLSEAYWFDDYEDLGFGPPPYGCEWVRYGPDLLLVDIDTGQILDVEYGVFY